MVEVLYPIRGHGALNNGWVRCVTQSRLYQYFILLKLTLNAMPGLSTVYNKFEGAAVGVAPPVPRGLGHPLSSERELQTSKASIKTQASRSYGSKEHVMVFVEV